MGHVPSGILLSCGGINSAGGTARSGARIAWLLAMPLVESQQFGPLSYDAEAEIHFPQGLPGFDHEHRFILLEPASLSPLIFLQSSVTPSLCFTALPVSAIDPSYELQLSAEEHQLLGEAPSLTALAILSNGEDGSLTANLLAPVAIDLANRVAIQAVRSDSRYSHAQRLGEAIACS